MTAIITIPGAGGDIRRSDDGVRFGRCLARRFFQQLTPPARQYNCVTLTQQRQCDATADACSGTGDDCRSAE